MRTHVFLAAVLVATLVSLAAAHATVHGVLVDVPKMTHGSQARVQLDGGARVALADTAGQFVFSNVEAGSHVVDVTLGDLVFPQVRLDVSEKTDRFRAVFNDGSNRVLVNAMNDNSAADAAASAGADYPLVQLAPVGQYKYYVPREHFSIWSLLKNPMILMMVVSAGLVYVMPLMVDQDDMRAQMKDLQAQASPQVQQQQQGQQPARRVTSQKK
jgi:hypothetical protein